MRVTYEHTNDADLDSIQSSHMTGIVHIHFFLSGLDFLPCRSRERDVRSLLKGEVSKDDEKQKFDDDRNEKREIRRKNKLEDRIRVKIRKKLFDDDDF